MFVNNKYFKWYNNIIDNAKRRLEIPVPFEKHHIIPKSLGGSDKETNLCKLSLKEHFICHLLLTKCTTNEGRNKMIYAFWGMTHRNEVSVNARTYQTLKQKFMEINNKSNVEKFGHIKAAEISQKIGAGSKGRVFDRTSRKKMSESHKGKVVWNKGLKKDNNLSLKSLSTKLTGRPRSSEGIEKQRKTITGNKRIPHNDVSKAKNAESNRNRPYFICEHCGKSAQKGNYNRWHGEKCKKYGQ